VAYFGYTLSGEKRKQRCMGCRLIDKKCAFVKKKCTKLSKKQVKFCYECSSFPCKDLEKLDRRHRQDFGDNPIDNLKQIQENGIEVFLEKEREMWKCAGFGVRIAVWFRCSLSKQMVSGNRV